MCTVVSKAIVKLHGGEVSVHSDGLGKGCTFTVDLPLCSPDRPIEPYKQNFISEFSALAPTRIRMQSKSTCVVTDSSHASTNRSTPQGTIYRNPINTDSFAEVDTNSLIVMVVDDVELNRKMLFRLIRKKFKQLIEANDGQQAVEYIKQSILEHSDSMPDIILMDSVMSHMDGPQATKEIRALGFSGLIVGITGNAQPEDIQHFMDHGADHVLIKPINLEELQATIQGKYFANL